MIITKLIEKLESLGEISKPLFASLNDNLEKKFYVELFGDTDGRPTIFISKYVPLPENKNSNTLLIELLVWKNENLSYNSDVYLSYNYKYEDKSYDFRYFKLNTVYNEGDSLILIAEVKECIELREHYEAFDDSMLDDDCLYLTNIG